MDLLTTEDCKRIISEIAKKLCVRPRLITERLLSYQDKDDMRAGDLPIEALECHIRAWMDSGMSDYAHGKTVPLDIELKEAKFARTKPTESVDQPKGLQYRKPFVDPRTYTTPSSDQQILL